MSSFQLYVTRLIQTPQPFVYDSGVPVTKHKVCLVIIDPQNDFVGREDENLAKTKQAKLKVNKAVDDMNHLARMIRDHGEKIDEIVVTMDAHMQYHISHPCYWKDAEGNNPSPFTQITLEDYMNKTWTTARPEDAEFTKAYLQKLAKKDRFTHTIWPPHCLIGSSGQAIDPALYDALMEWENQFVGRTVKYVQKGNDAHTEMYSALRAEVPVSVETNFNRALASHIGQFDRVLVGGEASSHCVNFSVRDLMEKVPANKLYLLTDAMHHVDGSKDQAEEFVEFVKSKGGHLVSCASFFTE